jgi:hydrogenase nickel incorporation protein HypB
MKIRVIENVLKLNDEVAAINRRALKDAGVYTIDLIGAPGCGKTALLEVTLQHLRDELEIGVLVGDLTTSRDAERIAQWTNHVVQINTGHGCHLDANQVRQGLQQLDLAALDVLVIENVGNLICPVGFDLGQDDKVGMFSVAEGDDKAAKHPYLVRESSVVLLNKLDLLPYVRFDLETFCADVKRLNADVGVLEISAANDRISMWLDWLVTRQNLVV